MAEKPPGFPNWVDLGTPDLPTATAFYTGLFGWTATISEDPEYGSYTIFNKDGVPVAGAGTLVNPDQPTAWSTYIATDDADATATQVEAAGGKVLISPFDVGVQGRMAAFLDPGGAPFSVWQPMAMRGAELFDAPGAMTWNELTTRDVAGSTAFYRAVFGWTAREQPMGDDPYLVWELDGQMLGGLMPMVGDLWPADLPPHWMVYFAVTDCDAAAGRTAELGGAVSVPPTDIPFGRFAVLNDPQGAVFSILAGAGH